MSEADGIARAGVGNGSESALAGRAVRAERRTELLGRVIKAGVRVASEIGLDHLLVRIVEAGCELTGARYGASAWSTRPVRSSPSSSPLALRRRLGDLPPGRGILGALSRNATALRLDAIREDPRSIGFPPGHPPMQSFLGVPIVVREAPFGNLCLTEKRDCPFTAQEEEAFTLLAAQPGVVLEHARMVEASRRWSEQQEALADVTSAFTREIDVESLLNVIADQLLGVVDARSVVIELLEPGGQLRAAVVAGDRAERVVVGAVATAASKAHRVLGRRRSEPSTRPWMIRKSIRMPRQPNWASARGGGSPWVTRGRPAGIATIADKRGTDARFGDADLRVAETLVQRAAEAIDPSDPWTTSASSLPWNASHSPRPPTTCGSSSSPSSPTVPAFDRR